MLDDSISPKTYRLLNVTTDRVKGLTAIECVLGLERLKLVLGQDNHRSYGIYFKSGIAVTVECLDGELSPTQRDNIAHIIDKSADAFEYRGYYFIHPSDSAGMDNYSHYFTAKSENGI